jgi:hypothetical protein
MSIFKPDYNVDVAGGAVHVETVVDGGINVIGGVPYTFSAFSSTGITCPVPKSNFLCPITIFISYSSTCKGRFQELLPLRMDAISPE